MLYAGGGLSVILAAIFVSVILWHYARLAVQRRSLGRTIFSGGCLLPLFFWIYILSVVPVRVDDLGSFFCMLCGLSGFVAFLGALAGFLTAVLIEAARLAWASIGISRRKRRSRIRGTAVSSPRRLDDDITPLEMPSSYFLPRRFGVRGMLVLVTLASVLMALMQAVRVPAGIFLSVVVFVAGVLGGQVLLFRGRKPQTASAWVGAFLVARRSDSRDRHEPSSEQRRYGGYSLAHRTQSRRLHLHGARGNRFGHGHGNHRGRRVCAGRWALPPLVRRFAPHPIGKRYCRRH